MKVQTWQMNPKRGITLVALVITIIVLLILAGITISLTIGQNGIITRAQEAGKNYLEAQNKELADLADLEEQLDEAFMSDKALILEWDISEWDKTLVSPGEFNPEWHNYDYEIDWGDGTVSHVTSEQPVTHTYQAGGTYQTKIVGICEFLTTQTYEDDDKLKKVVQWGDVGLKNVNLSQTAITQVASPNKNTFAQVTNLNGMFSYCHDLTSIPADLFKGCTNVISFDNTFYQCDALTSIPADLFKECTNVTSFYRYF